MKKLIRLLFLVVLVLAVGLEAKDVSVKGYYRQNGTYVAPYHRTSPNNTKNDNESTGGHVNPYTGKPISILTGHTLGIEYLEIVPQFDKVSARRRRIAERR